MDPAAGRSPESIRAENERLTAEAAELRRRVALLESETIPVGAPPRPSGALPIVMALMTVGAVALTIALVLHSKQPSSVGGATNAAPSSSAPFGELSLPAGVVLPKERVSGALQAAGPSLGGSWTLESDHCLSGERMQFFGVDLVDKTNPAHIVRAVEDAVRGPSVSVNRPDSAKGWRFEPQECRSLTVNIRRTNATINKVRVFDGELTADCTLPDGTTFVGAMQFTGCH